ncbi:MAG TPA: hypothetical protein VFT46_07175 [Holophagaceae bacterium]|nr:hypothetical protein [Holophagaceae bacterium]
MDAVTFSNGQVVGLLLAALGGAFSIAGWGVMRLIRTIDSRFDELKNDLKDIRSEYAPRAEMDAKFDGVHGRVDDLHRLLRRRWDDAGQEG